ncbi:MAG: acyl-CoA thioesterase [Leptospiraceae bacterium]|nr:acyl-CoA thioesterase [Leptospiraceae bacterium]
MNQSKKYSLEIRVRWNELDSNNHVNNSYYFNYFDEARMTALDEMGFGLASMRDKDIGPAIYKAELEFQKPLHHPESVIVDTHFENTIKFRSECVQTIYRKSDNGIVCKARFYCLFIRISTAKPFRANGDEFNRITKMLTNKDD